VTRKGEGFVERKKSIRTPRMGSSGARTMLANTEEDSITSFPLIDQKQSLCNEPLVRLLFETGERGMNFFLFLY